MNYLETLRKFEEERTKLATEFMKDLLNNPGNEQWVISTQDRHTDTICLASWNMISPHLFSGVSYEQDGAIITMSTMPNNSYFVIHFEGETLNEILKNLANYCNNNEIGLRIPIWHEKKVKEDAHLYKMIRKLVKE